MLQVLIAFLCQECEKANAAQHCFACDASFCEKCDASLHTGSRVMQVGVLVALSCVVDFCLFVVQRHSRVPLAKHVVEPRCSEHDEKLKLFCTVCQVCLYSR